MPLNRYQLRNEYSLADPELYKVADKDDPEALLEGVAMAGLVGVLRQLGDLAEFAAEIFHDLHEEVMATSARGHGLIVRVQQLEAEFPSIERALLSQTNHTSFLYNTGVDWHPNLRMDQGVVTRGDLPRFVMDSYEECRGPPRLFLLDKFDVAGAGACLKRFTDPSFFKIESTSSTGRNLEGQREKKTRRVKKRGPRWRIGDTPDTFPSSHAKLHQLFLEERIESGINDPARRVKLKKRQFTGSLFEQDNVKSYMEKFLDTSPQEQNILHEICVDPLALTWISDIGCEAGPEIVEIGTVSPVKGSIQSDRSLCPSPDAKQTLVKPSLGEDFNQDKFNFTSDNNAKVESGEDIAGRESLSVVSVDDACDYDDVASETDNYVDALANIESEVETDSDTKKNPHYSNLKPITADSDGSERQLEFPRVSLDSQSFGNSITSEDGDHCSKERERSSCSNSVNTLIETTPDLDTAVVAVSTSQACNSDSGNMFFDHHSTSEEILIKEREKHAAAGVVNPEVHDILKSEQEFVKASNTSSLADTNKKVLPVHMEVRQGENSLKDPESGYSAKLDVAEGEMDQGLTDQTVNSPLHRTSSFASEDSGQLFSVEPSTPDKEGQNHCVSSDIPCGTSNMSNGLVHFLETDSHDSACSLVSKHDKDLGMADVETFPDSGLPREHLTTFDPAYSENSKSIYVAREEDDSIPSNDMNSKDLYSASKSSASLEKQELLPGITNSGCTSSLDLAAENLPCSWVNPCLENEAAEPTECGSFVADVAVGSSRDDNNEISGSADKAVNEPLMLGKPSTVLDPLEKQHQWLKLPSEATDSTVLELGQDEAHKQYSDSETYTGCSVSVGGSEGNAAPIVGLFDREPVSQNFTSINPDKKHPFEPDTLVDDPESQVETVYGEASIDRAPTDQLGDEGKISSHDASPLDIPCNYANTSDYVVAAANDSNLVHDVEKVEHIETVADGPRLVNVPDNYHQNGTTEQFCQNDEELAKGHRRALTDRRQTDPALDASVTSSGSMCNTPSDDSSSLKVFDGSQPDDVKISEKLAGQAVDLNPPSHDLLKSQYCEREEGACVAVLPDDDLPSVSKSSPLSAENTLETSNVAIHGNGLLNGGNEASQLENSGQPLCQQSFLDLGMRPAEPRISLEPPSLPPLPPMQWRLGRFQNSSTLAAGRQAVQHPRVPVQVQPMSLPTMHHTLAPVQSTTLPAVHHTIASFQPVALAAGNSTLAQIPSATLPTALPAVQYAFAPLQPVTLPTSGYGTETIAQTLTSEGQLGYPDAYVTQQGVFTLPMPVGISDGFFQINNGAVGRQDYLPSTIPLTSSTLDGYVAQQGVFTPSMPARITEGSSESNASEAGRQNNVPFMVSSSSTMLPDGTQISTKLHQLNPDLSESGSLFEVNCVEHTSTVESQMNTETAIRNDLLEQGLQVSDEEIVSSNMKPLLSSVVDQPPVGLVAPEAGRTWSGAYDEIPTHADGNINGTLQKKPPRPRNPLIDEVVAIDKSKLRKVDRTKPPLESKPEEGESLREQMHLRKVERVKPPVDSKGEGGEYLLEQLQLRKVGERVKPSVEQKAEEEFLLEQLQLRKVEKRVKLPVEPKSEVRESLLEQMQLRKVGEKTRQEIEPKVDETESPRIQLRKVGERVREEVELKAEETESPRMQLRKVGERAQPLVGQKEEDRDSLFQQIRNKSFNLKPAVAARPNIQGPRTNLKVAAILEKASTIRQAMAGSDEDDDADSWSE